MLSMLAFWILVVVFSFLGTVYPLQIRRNGPKLYKRPAVQYSFQTSICYSHKLLIFTGFYLNRSMFSRKWMKWLPKPWGLLWTGKIGWNRERQVEINSIRERHLRVFVKVTSATHTKNRQSEIIYWTFYHKI